MFGAEVDNMAAVNDVMLEGFALHDGNISGPPKAPVTDLRYQTLGDESVYDRLSSWGAARSADQDQMRVSERAKGIRRRCPDCEDGGCGGGPACVSDVNTHIQCVCVYPIASLRCRFTSFPTSSRKCQEHTGTSFNTSRTLHQVPSHPFVLFACLIITFENALQVEFYRLIYRLCDHDIYSNCVLGPSKCQATANTHLLWSLDTNQVTHTRGLHLHSSTLHLCIFLFFGGGGLLLQLIRVSSGLSVRPRSSSGMLVNRRMCVNRQTSCCDDNTRERMG
jgi:hypothetical protein